MFYAALGVMAWAREQIPVPGGRAEGEGVKLDKLMDRSEPSLVVWIEGGEGGAYMDEVGDLSSPGAGVRVLRVAARRLMGLKVWRVGELLGRTLVELANEEERRGQERQGQQEGEVKMEQ